MLSQKTHILVAVAWPYANGSLHLGHITGLISADVIARYFRSRGNPVLMVSGTDCHGTPVVLLAEKEGKTPAEIAATYYHVQADNLKSLGFSYDIYTTTTTPNHTQVVQEIFLKLYHDGLIYTKVEAQAYCDSCAKFLPDRYIEGTCPHCGFTGARGDQCDNCGKLLDPKELKDPRCKLCGGSPVWKDTEHFFLKLSAMQDKISAWVEGQAQWRKNAYNFSLNYIKEGLHDRAITRDTEWGVPIPLPGYESKRIYVWFEAVIGYLSATKEYFQKYEDPEAWKRFWYGSDVYHYYTHGKDNIPFHTIIWPSILLGFDEHIHLPDQIVSTEYLNIEGQKLSKSRNIAVWVPDVVPAYNPDAVRFYILYNLPERGDSDFQWSDFREKNNNDLVGKLGNFVNRVLAFTAKNFEQKVPAAGERSAVDAEMVARCQEIFDKVGGLIEKGEIKQSLREVLDLVYAANQYIDQRAPWKLLKESRDEAGAVLNVCFQIINTLRVLLAPYLPFTVEKLGGLLNLSELSWGYSELPAGHGFLEPKILFEKIEQKDA